MSATDELLLADEAEDAGAWEEAAWRRLLTSEESWWAGKDGSLLELWQDRLVFQVGDDVWIWAKGDGLWCLCRYVSATRLWTHRAQQPPPCVRRAVEEAAAMAVAAVLRSS